MKTIRVLQGGKQVTESKQPLVQWTVAELIVVLVTASFTIGAMWAHKSVVWLVMSLAMVLVFAMLAIAFVGRRDWRVFGVGFSAFAIGYFLTLAIVERSSESIPNTMGQLPTTYALMLCQESLTYVTYKVDGEVIPSEREPKLLASGTLVDRDGNRLGSNLVGPFIPGLTSQPKGMVIVVHTPDPLTFHTLGQIFWMLLFGYLGGKFAVAFVRYQDRRETLALTSV